MSLTATANIKVQLNIAETLALGVGSGTVNTLEQFVLAFGNGTGANNIQEYYTRDHTAAASPDTYTLSALTDAAGRSVAFAKVRGLMIVNLDATHPLTVGNAGTHPWSAPFDAATDTVTIRPGGCLLRIAPDATAYPVVASTTDQLKIDPGANSVEYQIAIIGE